MPEPDIELSQKIIHEAKAKIDSHNEFKKAYNQELAFDFDLFRFFNVDENKISQILASFFKPDGRHGQGDLFIRDFIERLDQKLQEPIYLDKKQNETESRKIYVNPAASKRFKNAIRSSAISNINIRTERPIDPNPESIKRGKRRIDIYIPLGGYAIAVENKVWAKDQPDQMIDYKNFLLGKYKEKHVLVYLTPYGNKPKGISMTGTEWENGLAEGMICSMSYKYNIIPMLESWEAKCKAERVRSFIREFKNHLLVKFLGGNNMTMTKSLKPLILQNVVSVKELSKAYLEIRESNYNKIKAVAKLIEKQMYHKEGFKIVLIGPFLSADENVVKLSITSNEHLDNIIYPRLGTRLLKFEVNHYFHDNASQAFRDNFAQLQPRDLDENLTANGLFKAYDEYITSIKALIIQGNA